MKQNIIRDGKEMIFFRTCSVTNELYIVSVKTKDYLDWKGGKLIQSAMNYLKPEEREFIKSNITPHEWDRMFEEL